MIAYGLGSSLKALGAVVARRHKHRVRPEVRRLQTKTNGPEVMKVSGDRKRV